MTETTEATEAEAITPLQLLTRGRELIEAGWTQGVFARDAKGEPLDSYDPEASPTCYCTIGAVHRAAFEFQLEDIHAGALGEGRYRALKAIQRAVVTNHRDLYPGRMILEKVWVGAWNDAEDRTKEEVLAVYDKAIEIATADRVEEVSR